MISQNTLLTESSYIHFQSLQICSMISMKICLCLHTQEVCLLNLMEYIVLAFWIHIHNKLIFYHYFIKVDFFIKISTLSRKLFFLNFKTTDLHGVITVLCSWPLMIMEIQPCATAKCILDVRNFMPLYTNTHHWRLKAIAFLDKNCSSIFCHAIGIT